MPASYQTIRYQRHADIGTLTLARPGKRNAQNPLMWQELAQLGADLLPDETLRCLVVTGEGPAFSAGIDLVEGIAGMLADLAERPPDSRSLAAGRAAAGTFSWIPDLGCASVAAVRGHAYGAGLQLALACDFRIFAEGTKVGLLETRYGLMPDMGATVRLPRIVGESRARELILLGDVIDAAEALRIGLANRVVTSEDLDAAAAELAARLAAQPPLAVRGARRAIDAAWHRGPAESLRLALEEQIRCLQSDDFAEARQAMAEGRDPHWQGR
ncbi:MAG TPA: enoyl-CoA hydratase/isomerase family protein [Streptosporangiaceae bacterium]|nr:enoyl-CoA hydratase/isomerase family protein [Streptosporangiaceae bacterium]